MLLPQYFKSRLLLICCVCGKGLLGKIPVYSSLSSPLPSHTAILDMQRGPLCQDNNIPKQPIHLNHLPDVMLIASSAMKTSQIKSVTSEKNCIK